MKFSIAAATAALSATALAAPAPASTPTCPSGDGMTIYQIDQVYSRKYDGQNINTFFFNIQVTNGGTLDFECAPYDPAVGRATESFESGKVYSCGENSFFSFSYNTKDSDNLPETLFLWQNVSDTETLTGRVSVPEPSVCRAGGSSINDLICTAPDQEYLVKMEEAGA